MMNLRQRSVNVLRSQLLEKLKENLVIHQREYQEALLECHRKLLEDLRTAYNKVETTTNPEKLKKFQFRFQFPQNHEQDYKDVIEMLEMSTDNEINLDAESFKAYIKNEWSWTGSFNSTKALYSNVGSAFMDDDAL